MMPSRAIQQHAAIDTHAMMLPMSTVVTHPEIAYLLLWVLGVMSGVKIVLVTIYWRRRRGNTELSAVS